MQSCSVEIIKLSKLIVKSFQITEAYVCSVLSVYEDPVTSD